MAEVNEGYNFRPRTGRELVAALCTDDLVTQKKIKQRVKKKREKKEIKTITTRDTKGQSQSLLGFSRKD